MSLPPVVPKKTTAGISVDPSTLERVVPESRRPDGSIRKERKIRPGFTPQEDLERFRGTRQQVMDRNTLPKGHILGWVAPSSDATKPKSSDTMSKSAKKNEKRKEKRGRKKEEAIRANWEDEDVVKDEDGAPNWAETSKVQKSKPDSRNGKEGTNDETEERSVQADLERQLDKLEIQ